MIGNVGAYGIYINKIIRLDYRLNSLIKFLNFKKIIKYLGGYYMKKLSFLLTTIAFSFIMIVNANAQSRDGDLTYKIYRADENSFHVASILIQGKKDAVLIDAQFTLSDAHRVVADILESRKNLTAIYISHGDPDYYFGLGVLKDAFPNVVVYATAPVIKHIKDTYQNKLDYWGKILGPNGPVNVIIPQVVKGNSIKLEGKNLIIKGLDGPTPERTYVWIPSIKAIVGGVNIYDNLHLWIADARTKKERIAWLNILKEMESLRPEIVIPAHALNDNNTKSRKAITFSKNYLMVYEREAAKTKNSKELIAAMQKQFPKAGLGIALQIGAKVVKGEMDW